MHEVNNAAKDASLSVSFQQGLGLHGPYYRRRQLLVVFSVGVGRRWWWQPGGGGQRRQWRRPAVSWCWISGSLRSLHDSTARHTTSACALWTPALLWFLHHKDWERRPRLPDVPHANHHDSAPVLVFYSWITVRPTLYFSELRFSDICLPVLGLFAISQCSSHTYVDLSISASP